MPSISVMSSAAEPVVIRSAVQSRITHRVNALAELRTVLDGLAAAPWTRTLDLIGHSTREAKLLRLGTTVIDMCKPSVASWFEQLAADAVLDRLGVVAVRLLGCETAATPTSQLTIRLLASVLGMPVYGTRKIVLRSHYTDEGFDSRFTHVLIESTQLPNPPRRLF